MTTAQIHLTPETMKKSVLVIDPFVAVREGIRAMVSASGYEVVSSVGSLKEAEVEVLKWNLDIIVLEPSGCDADGDPVTVVKQLAPGVPILVYSRLPEDRRALELFRQGAAGFVTKLTTADVFLAALDKISNGGRFISERLSLELTRVFSSTAPHTTLSPRELQTLVMIASGKSLKEVAAQIGVSRKSVTTYRARTLEKLDLHSTADLVRYAIEHHLVN